MAKMTKKEQEAVQLEQLQDSMLSEYGKTLPEEYFSVSISLSQSLLKMMSQYERFAKQHNLTYNAMLVLLCLRFGGTQLSQGILSKFLFLPKQTVGSILVGFKKKNYVIESPSPVDARSKILVLTKEGEQFADSIFTQLQEIDSQALIAVPKEQFEATLDTIDAYNNAFEKALTNATESFGK